MKQPETKEPQKPEIPVNVQDAFAHSFDIVNGLDSILSAGTCSDEGFSSEACKTLNLSVEKLIEYMETMKDFFEDPK